MDEVEDVNVGSSPTNEEVVNADEVVATDQQEQIESVQEPNVADIATDVAPSLEVGKSSDDVDEMGVPYKNRYHEYKRKTEKLEGKLDEVLKNIEAIKPKQHSRQELEYFANNNPEHEAWAKQEIAKLDKQEQVSLVRQELQEFQRKQQEAFARKQTLDTVINQYPDIAIKDKAGNFLGFNSKSEMFQRVNSYMLNPEIANNPRGLEVASALAYRDVSLTGSKKIKATVSQQNAKIKNLQKRTLIEGNSKVPINVAPDPVERLRQTGSKKDALQALDKYFGFNKE